MNGIIYIDKFLSNPEQLYHTLEANADWDESMSARKTASYGVAYNYSQMSYPYKAFIPELSALIPLVERALAFEPNNCLINFYLDGSSKMGFHSDQTDILAEGTGIAILSLGTTRTLRFRKIADTETIKDYSLPAGSLIYMSQQLQNEWQHSIPKEDTDEGRMSLTFRKIITKS